MEWIQGRIYGASGDIEPLTGFLMEHGIMNTQIDDEAELRGFLLDNPLQWDYIDDSLISGNVKPASILFWVPSNPSGLEILNNIKTELSAAGFDPHALVTDAVDDADWLDEWKKYFKPLKIGKRIIVRPIWEHFEPGPGETVFSINPGHVFGTGLHQTTQMCIECLERYVTAGCSILDLGCGSGILFIIGMLLGAGRAFGCDFDPSAEDIAGENARLNHIPPAAYTIVTGNAITGEHIQTRMFKQPKFDIITANIVADAVIALTETASRVIRQNGVFISSGIIGERLDEVRQAIESHGFDIIETIVKDDWYCLAARYA